MAMVCFQLKAQPDQALRNGTRLFAHLGPSPSLPEAKILEAKRGAFRAGTRGRAKVLAKVSSAFGLSPAVAKPFLRRSKRDYSPAG